MAWSTWESELDRAMAASEGGKGRREGEGGRRMKVEWSGTLVVTVVHSLA